MPCYDDRPRQEAEENENLLCLACRMLEANCVPVPPKLSEWWAQHRKHDAERTGGEDFTRPMGAPELAANKRRLQSIVMRMAVDLCVQLHEADTELKFREVANRASRIPEIMR